MTRVCWRNPRRRRMRSSPSECLVLATAAADPSARSTMKTWPVATPAAAAAAALVAAVAAVEA